FRGGRPAAPNATGQNWYCPPFAAPGQSPGARGGRGRARERPRRARRLLAKLTILTAHPAALHHRSSPSSMRIVRSGFLIALALFGTMLAGCSSLLPRGSDATQVPWKTFEEARAAVEAIEPFRTRKSTLMQNGFDPYHNPAVTILSYPEIIQRFAAGSALQGEEYEHGIRSCLLAGQACSGYSK